MLSVAELIHLLNNIPSRYKTPDDICFDAANQKYIAKYKKLGVITVADELQDGAMASSSTEFFCNVPGCQNVFEDAGTYQTHFNNVHRYLCSICRRSLPTAHLLDLHVSERHDSYFATRVERGEAMYACFLEECKQKMLTQEQRKDHCINIHKFPSNFRFEYNEKKAPSTRNTSQNQKKQGTDPVGIPGVSTKVNEIKAISFGHPKEKTFQAHSAPKSKDGLKDLHGLKDALDDI
ncbi:protein lethal(2)k10201 [Anastrepha obliqua]|uniref:protein lethal(2)k10201 n=1 Tax=Anastrepha obliqua TaxID=95512 RepID=UPI0024096A6C|nr:protein lethal(2)k10201 [Anastrepha obliqua]